MKISIVRLAILLGLLAIAADSLQATVLVNETFTYADGGLAGQDPAIGGPWAAHSGAGTNSIQVNSGAALINGNGEDVNVAFEGGAIGAGDVIYAGFDLTVPTGSVTTSANFAHFLQGTSVFGARVWITPAIADGDYRLALSGDNSITDADGEVFTGDLAFDTTYRIVTKYNYDDGDTRLWLDPGDESSAAIQATDVFVGDEFVAFALRQSLANSTQRIDNLVVATTFSEALGVIPEPTSLGLMVLSLGALVLRRK